MIYRRTQKGPMAYHSISFWRLEFKLCCWAYTLQWKCNDGLKKNAKEQNIKRDKNLKKTFVDIAQTVACIILNSRAFYLYKRDNCSYETKSWMYSWFLVSDS